MVSVSSSDITEADRKTWYRYEVHEEDKHRRKKTWSLDPFGPIVKRIKEKRGK